MKIKLEATTRVVLIFDTDGSGEGDIGLILPDAPDGSTFGEDATVYFYDADAEGRWEEVADGTPFHRLARFTAERLDWPAPTYW